MKKSIINKKMMGLLVAVALVLSMATFVSGSNTRMMKQQIYSHGTNVLGDWDVYPGDSIQQAIDDASPGDTIYVHDDNGNPYTYNENVDVNKPNLELIGDGMDMVTVDAVNEEGHTFHLTEDGITVTGFTVTGSYSCGYGAICLEYADNCVISDNNCRENLCAGIFLKHSSNCEIINNIVSDNDCGGIKLSGSDNNIVKSNIMENNVNMGMNAYDGSSGNLIYNNYFDNPGRNAVDGVPWANTWNISKTSGINIVGGQYRGGNYFSDYTGDDNDGDGLGDIPYDIKNAPGTEVTNKDYLPLVISSNPPDAPAITGSTSGTAGEEYEYSFVTTDPNGDDVYYYIDWGDESFEEWIGPYESGEEVKVSHTWDEEGTYTIKAKAKDIYNAESDWGTLEVSMPRNKLSNMFFLQFLERLFERFPLLEHIFYQFTT
jgi:parallel beta-helix repeat protein